MTTKLFSEAISEVGDKYYEEAENYHCKKHGWVKWSAMVTKVYAHILDEDRKVNAQKFESAFYANPDLRGVQAPAEPAPALDVQSIILQLQQSPELLSALTSLISNQGCK